MIEQKIVWVITSDVPYCPSIRYFDNEEDARRAWEKNKSFYSVSFCCLAKVVETAGVIGEKKIYK